MKMFTLCFLIVLSNLMISCTNTTPHPVNQEKELLAAVNEFNQAFKEGNVKKLASMITDDYHHTNGNAKPISKDDWIGYLTKRSVQIENGDIKVNTYQMEETDIKFHDHTAILTAKITVSTSKGDTTQQNQYRVTNFWVHQDGSWKRAGFHDGKIE
ncbi:nuclear transport factor 2 family protein [Aquimarina spongiae]|uniref:DUF4440 domain-containing protein n=1 Tax=Aquimarina spongiae TaxID=570521 RepID=A0A1M6H573_9FLAO|nr:nuclear transport factor 2 family protein [Aquimarina spongiae]SHJ17229.1 protein of unknown function [Aquimarina spongiae]